MPLDKDEYNKFIEDEIEERFKEFKSSFISRIRKPAIGIIVAISALIALAGIYVYIDASAKVYQSQAELAKAQKEFYESMRDSEKEVLEIKNNMISNFNVWADDAEKKMLLMQESLEQIETYESKFKEILERHKKSFAEGPHDSESRREADDLFGHPEFIPFPNDDSIMPTLPQEQKSYRIDPRQQGIIK